MTESREFDKSEYTKVPLKEINKSHILQKIHSFGWVYNRRNAGQTGCFINMFAQYKILKCLYPHKIDADNLTRWTSMDFYGTVKENFTKDGAEVEFHIDHYDVRKIAPSFPVNKDTQAFSLLENGHLALRTPERIFFLKARSYMLRCFREFFYEREFTEITPPTLVQTQVEGGSTLFKLDYFGKKAFLTQSSQLYLETVVPVAMKAYCMVYSYRAEKSNTTRHLTEYTHVEAELADICFDDLLSVIEDMVYTVVTGFYEKMREDILELCPDYEFFEFKRPFKRISYKDAIKYFNDAGYKKDNGLEFVLGDDIPDAAEVFLVKSYADNTPLFLTNFETAAKPFYMKTTDDPKYTESADLLFPNIGEILGGSMRKEEYQELIDGFEREGIDSKPYYWYTDMARFGPCTHGGFGLGFERLLVGLMRWKNVAKGCLYPRFVTRCHP
ncbi:asparagine-tRNA ligase [Vavraia culicis subsp. floridensis]|uniref:asparagine--tRNA ligase n=1 Tax=Vavraia culicis (isolate floridensis) TaxID=948595 RepID=L2GTD1_VAVCU|nr:asparagine-tRNA ligase [Vavraia culicis subsp. floridensis]ELA46906.1 asparagine-tRNA ligase [Vavraia culicis subsp. floridensis]